jgi:hypothetical protein
VAVGTPRGRWPRRRLLALALAAAVVVIAGAAGAVVLLRPDDARDGSTAASGTYNATGPWRLRVDGTGYGQGCTVSLTNTTSGTDVPLPRDLYGVARFQVAGSGSFRWQSNDAQCLVTPLAGSGTATLPMLQELDGDTDAIEAPGKLAVQIVDNKGSNCTLRLFDATNGQALDIVKWEAGDGDVTLDPLDRQTVYISDDNCIIRVSAAT